MRNEVDYVRAQEEAAMDADTAIENIIEDAHRVRDLVAEANGSLQTHNVLIEMIHQLRALQRNIKGSH
jgi:hypothetical protein